jgi:hypothetical protein
MIYRHLDAITAWSQWKECGRQHQSISRVLDGVRIDACG